MAKRKFEGVPEIGDIPNQPKQFRFPDRQFGSSKVVTRKFMKDWFNKYPWLHYDETNDRAFCHTCITAYNRGHMTTADDTTKSAFISTGYTNWKDALAKKRGFALHEQSNSHKHAVTCVVTIPATTGDVGELLDEKHAEEKAVARQSLLKIFSNIRFLARQALPMRGDGKGEPNSNSNQLYRLRGEDNPFLLEWIKRKGNNYTSHDMQDEMLKVMALRILRHISAQISSVEFYAIMVDETSDVSNTEQLVLCIRWVDDELYPHEQFIGLHSLEITNADTIVKVIKDILLRMNVSLSKCRSQCYDGCSTMKGKKSGVAKQIKEIEEKALFTHCYTHSLNLAVGDAIKNSKVMKDALETTHEITKLIKKSPKRDAKLDAIKKEAMTILDFDEGRVETITLLCPTRWTVRAKSLSSIMSNYTYLKELWEWAVNNCSDTEMKARIRGVDVYMRTFDYVFGVYLGELILSHSDNLSKTLQNPTLSAVQGQDCANLTVKVLEKLRSEEKFDLFWENVSAKAKSLDVDDPKLSRKRGAPKRLDDFQGYGPAKPAQPDTPKDLYRKHYYEALDHVVNCVKERFNQEDYKRYAMLQELLLKAARKQPFDTELEEVVTFYKSDFDASLLQSQLKLLEEDIPEITDVNFTDVVKYLRNLHVGKRQLFSEVFRLSKLILVCPETNATSERSFSALRRAKMYLQSTMTQKRLNHMMMLHVHKERTDALDLIDVANDFVSLSEHRLSIFGKFQETDYKRAQVLVKTKSTQVSF